MAATSEGLLRLRRKILGVERQRSCSILVRMERSQKRDLNHAAEMLGVKPAQFVRYALFALVDQIKSRSKSDQHLGQDDELENNVLG